MKAEAIIREEDRKRGPETQYVHVCWNFVLSIFVHFEPVKKDSLTLKDWSQEEQWIFFSEMSRETLRFEGN